MPIFFLLIAYVILEFYVFISVWDHFGFVNTLAAIVLTFILGSGIIRNQGRFVLNELQQSVARGQLPDNRILHGLLIFFAGLLFAVPGFVSDGIALLLLLPGSRHLAVLLFKRQFAARIRAGGFGSGFRVFTFGGANVPPATGAPRPTAARTDWARDVSPKVIDITPVSSKTTEHPED